MTGRTTGSLLLVALSLLPGRLAAATPQAGGAPPGQEPGLAARLDGYLRERAAAGTFSGAVLVARGGEPFLRAAHGLADAEHGVPLAPESLFRIGSLTKPLTATATMALVERGALRLEDSVCRWLSRCPEAWRAVEVHHLLSHTSGIPDLFGEVEEAPLADTRAAIDRAVAAHGAAPLAAAAGERFAYSNFNYALLGYVMEAATGKGWEELLAELVFRPAGMRATRYDDVWAVTPGRARGYGRRDGALRNIEYDDHSAYAAGGLLSTVDDLLAFHRALQDGRLLSAAQRDRMLTPVRDGYAYGWKRTRAFGEEAVDHFGAIDGFTSYLLSVPERDLLFVVLENVGDSSARATACDLLALVQGADWPLLTTLSTAAPSPGALERAAGSYGAPGEEPRRLEAEPGGLRYRRGASAARLLPLGERGFVLDGSPDIVLELVGPAGEPATELRALRCGETLFSAPRLAGVAGG